MCRQKRKNKIQVTEQPTIAEKWRSTNKAVMIEQHWTKTVTVTNVFDM